MFDFSLFLCLFLYQFLWLIIRIDWQSSTTLIDISEIGFCFSVFPGWKKNKQNETKLSCFLCVNIEREKHPSLYIWYSTDAILRRLKTEQKNKNKTFDFFPAAGVISLFFGFWFFGKKIFLKNDDLIILSVIYKTATKKVRSRFILLAIAYCMNCFFFALFVSFVLGMIFSMFFLI